jgi:hypothetical protein
LAPNADKWRTRPSYSSGNRGLQQRSLNGISTDPGSPPSLSRGVARICPCLVGLSFNTASKLDHILFECQ